MEIETTWSWCYSSVNIRVSETEQLFKPSLVLPEDTMWQQPPAQTVLNILPALWLQGKRQPQWGPARGGKQGPRVGVCDLMGVSLQGHRGLHGAAQAHIQLDHTHLPWEGDASSDCSPPERGMVGTAWPGSCAGVWTVCIIVQINPCVWESSFLNWL